MPKLVEANKALSVMRSVRLSSELNNKFIKYCSDRNYEEGDVVRLLINALVEKEINPVLNPKLSKKKY